jgi:hypothetical protein
MNTPKALPWQISSGKRFPLTMTQYIDTVSPIPDLPTSSPSLRSTNRTPLQ